jgi:iron complex outermembrane recepter protein
MKKIKFLLVLLMMVGSVEYVSAQSEQNVSVKGTVSDQANKPVAGASISLYRVKDSFLVKIQVADERGNFTFTALADGDFFIVFTATGFENVSLPSFSFATAAGTTILEPVTMKRVAKELAGVTVTQKVKPVIEVKTDRVILNVASSINATGSNALELLRKSPGVQVDNENRISLNNKSGVIIYIDGRPSNLEGSDLVSVLTSMQSSNIEAIEIITNPSAKFQAGGNAGIINIRLKKNKAYGFNGTLSTTGIYCFSPKFDASTSFNYRTKNYNAFGNYGYTHGDWETITQFYREQKEGVFTNVFNQSARSVRTERNHGYKVGIDFFISKKSTIGILVNGNQSLGPNYAKSTTSIFRNPLVIDSVLLAENLQKRRVRRANYNVNYDYHDSTGRSLTFDADYTVYRSNSSSRQPNIYKTASGILLSDNSLRTAAFTKIDVKSIKGDYEQKGFGGRLGFGLAAYQAVTGNDFDVFSSTGLGDTIDVNRSRSFKYREQVNAVYVNYNRDFKRLSLQAGIRGEGTIAKSDLSTLTNIAYTKLDTSYFNLFPNISLTWKLAEGSTLGLSYSRRIGRPSYEDLNPFETPLDELTVSQGNTFVKPQFSNLFQLNYNYKQFITSVGYSHTKDFFTQVLDTIGGKKSIQTTRNIASQNVLSINSSAQLSITKWWNVFYNVNLSFVNYKGNISNTSLNTSATNFSFYQENNFIKKDWTLQVSGFYNGPSLTGVVQNKALWTVDVGLQKKIFSGDGTVKVAFADVFSSLKARGLVEYGGVYVRGNFRWESQLIKLSFSYRFGRNTVKGARQRATAAEAQNRRLRN